MCNVDSDICMDIWILTRFTSTVFENINIVAIRPMYSVLSCTQDPLQLISIFVGDDDMTNPANHMFLAL